MKKLEFLEYVNEKPVAKLGDYYTNGDIMIHKDFCEEIPEAALIPANKIGKGDINAIIDRATKYLNYVPYENNEKLGQKMIIDPVYIDFINDLIEDKENVDYIANKYSAIKVMRGDKLIAIVMPKKITLNHEQIKLIMVNNFKEYLAYMDLIPIEYKILGSEGINGLFLPRLFDDTQIKKVIRSHVKHNGGRWLGKFERRPGLIDQYTKMIGEQLDKIDKSGILIAMKRAEEKTKEEQACKTEN